MQKVIIVRYGEIFLKGKNYLFFENTLFKNLQRRLKDFSLKVEKIDGRFLVSKIKEEDLKSVIERIKCVFGLTSFSVASEVYSSLEEIEKECNKIKITGTFKVETKRADKTFPIKSFELSSKMGEVILKNNKDSKVDVHCPEKVVNIDIRLNNKTYISYEKINCLGGMPVGCAGKSMALLSGGIDSPVAAFLMAKRGLQINAVHFYSYPYTSPQARQKVIDLANIIKKYTGDINLYIVPFTKIQEEIHKRCSDELMVTLVRRFMMDIAERVAKQTNCSSIITGENLGQVASQTVEGITSTSKMAKDLVIFRPLIAFDKIEISNIAQKIGTYGVSILPYEDCCSVFLPKNPATHPKLEKVEENEKLLNREALISNAINQMELIKIRL